MFTNTVLGFFGVQNVNVLEGFFVSLTKMALIGAIQTDTNSCFELPPPKKRLFITYYLFITTYSITFCRIMKVKIVKKPSAHCEFVLVQNVDTL